MVKPFVSLCTPTFNRRPFIPIMIQCFLNQTYPKDRMEWIIVDDGTDSIEDIIKEANIPQISYFRVKEKMHLGKKRNYMHTKTKGSILVYMDDDDYYPPERVEHAVDTLLATPTALCAGSSEIYVYFNHINQMYQGGPYSKTHATAGTFAFRRELLDQTKYEEDACLAEEKAFLKNYTIPMVQLNPLKSILVFSHDHNTFDKKILLNNNSNPLFVPSDKTVDMFIKNEFERSIKKFFVKDMLDILPKYKPGDPIMKPDVLKQMAKIKEEREKLNAPGYITIQQDGQPPKAISKEDVVGILRSQQEKIKELTTKSLKQQEIQNSVIQKLKINIVEKDEEILSLKKTIQSMKLQESGTSENNIHSKILPDN